MRQQIQTLSLDPNTELSNLITLLYGEHRKDIDSILAGFLVKNS